MTDSRLPAAALSPTDLSPGARVGIGVVACAAAVLSFSSLSGLAASTGYTASVLGLLPVAWLLPVALDAAAGVATFVWLRASRAAVVALARRIAWCAIGLSVVGNGVQHAYAADGGRPHWLVAIAVGAVAPAVFGAVVHLAVVASSAPTGDAGTVEHTDEDWGPAASVTPPSLAATPAPAVKPTPKRRPEPTPLKSVPAAAGKRTSQQRLRERAKAVGEPYSGRTKQSELRERVEKAEAAKAAREREAVSA